MIDQRASVIAEARSWVGTPYHSNGDLKGIGVDCGMLLVRVFCDLGLAPAFDPRPYPAHWHLHRGDEKYLGFILGLAAEVDVPQPGDVMLFLWGRCYSHGGIVTRTKPLTIVHAYYPARRVIEDEVARDAALSDPDRKPRFFSVWETRAGS